MRRVETTLALGHAERRESPDRLGEALDHVPAQILQPEPVAEQPPRRRRHDDEARPGQALQPRLGLSPTTTCSCEESCPTISPATTTSVAIPTRTESFSTARVCKPATTSAISSPAWTARAASSSRARGKPK